MAVSRDVAKRALVKAQADAGLAGKALAWFCGWGESWLGPWTREDRFTLATVSIMARSAAETAGRQR